MSSVKMKYTSEKEDLLTNLVTIGPKILIETINNMSGLVERTVDASVKLPNSLISKSKKMCEIPEIECPPRCVCQISWEASPLEKLVCHIKVTNSASRERQFTFKALPFQAPAGTIQITPIQLFLEAGQTDVAVATYTVPATLAAGTYKTEILVTGAYEQAICIVLQVCDPQACECHIVQGEIPIRIRTHHWYDHFQCVEKCFEPVRKKRKE